MGDNTSIQWTSGPAGEPGYTLNPWSGCVEVHAGCTHCYARALPPSMRRGAKWGQVWSGGERVIATEHYMKQAYRWAREAARAGQRRKVFCASTADVLEVPEVPESWPRGWTEGQVAEASQRVRVAREAMNAARERLWQIIRETATVWQDGEPSFTKVLNRPGMLAGGAPGLDWLLLTKRPENWALVPEDVRPLVWLGTSVADQETADDLVPHLLSAEGFRYRFLSAEPLVAPVDLDLGRCDTHDREFIGTGHPQLGDFCTECAADGWSGELSFGHWMGFEGGIDWVIVGGESGRKARPFNVEWAEQLVRQCREAFVACFVKQLGAVPYDPREAGRDSDEPHPGGPSQDPDCRLQLVDHKGGDWDEWGEVLRVRQWPDAYERGHR